MENATLPRKIVRETTISVAATRQEQISADKADLLVTIKGSSLVTGSAALKKAKEVNQLVTALLDVGVKEEELSLVNIQVESSNGILARTSSASYSLRIRASKLDLLAEVLGAISNQKNVTLDQIIWRYPDSKQMQMEWLESCIAEAKDRAARIAAALGTRLLALHSFSQVWLDPEDARVNEARSVAGPAATALMARARAVELGFSLYHSKVVEQRVELAYVVNRREVTTDEQPAAL